jgi:hypothetical protein
MSRYVWVAEPVRDFVYLPYRSSAPVRTPEMSLVAESVAPDAATIAPVLREVVRKLDQNMPVFDAHTMQDVSHHQDLEPHYPSGGRHGPYGADFGDRRAVRPCGLLSEPQNDRDRHPHGALCGPWTSGLDVLRQGLPLGLAGP